MRSNFATLAQTTGDDDWQSPINISESGTAGEPFKVVDANSVTQLFWQDNIDGFMYTNNAGGNWGTPQPISLPFSTPFFTEPTGEFFEGQYVPVLVADSEGNIHAFWIDLENRLYYSRAQAANLPDASAWTNPQRLAQTAVGLAARIDADGAIHLAYFRTEGTSDAPTGIYVRRSVDGGVTWTDGINLYASNYLRALSAEQAHLQIESAADRLYIVWDDPFLEAVYLAYSTNGGETWQEPEVIDRRQPEDAAAATGPSRIDVLATNGAVHLVWRAQHGQEHCQQFHQWSPDGGETWQEPEAIFEDSADCLTTNHLLAGMEDDLVFLLTKIRSEFYLRAWDGEQWSESEQQSYLAGFVHPQVFRQVTLDCLQYDVTDNNHLFVLGCGSSLTTDIWALQRPLGDTAEWATFFPEASPWSFPTSVAQMAHEPMWISLVTDNENRLHAFWSQVEPVRNITEAVVYYAQFEEDRWSEATPIVSYPSGGEETPVLAVDSQNEQFYLFWSSDAPNKLYVSRASIRRAATVAEWTDPEALPVPPTSSTYLDVAVDRSGTIYAAFSVPLNEERGLYFTKSEDNGDTWDDPAQIFKGRSADWEMVGEPQIALAGDNQIHLTVARYTLPPEFESVGFGYLRSTDGGDSWSEVEPVTEAPLAWHRLVSTGFRVVHRLWQEAGSRDVTWHAVSGDNGRSWSEPMRVSEFGQAVQHSAVTADNAGRLHLLHVIRDIQDNAFLQQWLWDGETWTLGDALQLRLPDDESGVDQFDALYRPSGQLAAMYTNDRLELVEGVETAVYQVMASQRSLEVPADQIQVLPTLTPTPLPLPPTPTAVPEVTPTPDLQAIAVDDADNQTLQIGPLNTGSSSGQLAFGILPALLIVLAVFGAGAYVRRVRKY